MPDLPVLLQIGSFTTRMADQLAPRFEILSLFEAPDRAALLAARGADVVAICTDGHWGIPDDVFEACPKLQVAASYGVGYDGIDVERALSRGILVSHTPDVLNDEVAATALMLWFAVARRLVLQDAWARSGTWERRGNAPLTQTVVRRQVGVLGFGRIGQTIARLAEAHGATVHYHARSRRDAPQIFHPNPVALAHAVDVLIVITPGGSETRHLVNRPVLDALGPEGILINVARGSVVDEDALVSALVDGRLGGAGLDVFADEPTIPEAIKSLENVVLTPHIGSATYETRAAMGDLVCDNLIKWLQDGTLKTPVPECAALLA
ncbi:MAG: 2-hydroxyacid dehydrogenase [Pseudomonadota bacterium]